MITACLSEVCLPKRPVLLTGKALWRASSVFRSLCLLLSQAGRTQTEVLPSWSTNPHFLWNFQRRFFPVQIPQPLNFPGRNSENNSEERKMEGRSGWEGEGGHSTLPHLLPPLSSFLLSSGYQWSVLLRTTLNKDLTSYLFSLLIRFPQSVYWFLQRVTTRCRSAAVPLLLFLRHVCFHPPSELGWYKPWSD